MSNFDRVAHVYDATRSLSPEVMSKVIDGILNYVGGSSIVDFGVGTGRFAAPLVSSGLEVVGLDISTSMIRKARDKGVRGLVLASAVSTPFRPQSFDYAMVVHFMHLLEEWRAAIREVSRVARKGLITLVGDPLGSRPRDMYVELRERRGFRMAGLRLGEREMADMVKPALMRKLVEYREEFDPSALLERVCGETPLHHLGHTRRCELPDSGRDEAETRKAERAYEKCGTGRMGAKSTSLVRPISLNRNGGGSRRKLA